MTQKTSGAPSHIPTPTDQEYNIYTLVNQANGAGVQDDHQWERITKEAKEALAEAMGLKAYYVTPGLVPMLATGEKVPFINPNIEDAHRRVAAVYKKVSDFQTHLAKP